MSLPELKSTIKLKEIRPVDFDISRLYNRLSILFGYEQEKFISIGCDLFKNSSFFSLKDGIEHVIFYSDCGESVEATNYWRFQEKRFRAVPVSICNPSGAEKLLSENPTQEKRLIMVFGSKNFFFDIAFKFLKTLHYSDLNSTILIKIDDYGTPYSEDLIDCDFLLTNATSNKKYQEIFIKNSSCVCFSNLPHTVDLKNWCETNILVFDFENRKSQIPSYGIIKNFDMENIKKPENCSTIISSNSNLNETSIPFEKTAIKNSPSSELNSQKIISPTQLDEKKLLNQVSIFISPDENDCNELLDKLSVCATQNEMKPFRLIVSSSLKKESDPDDRVMQCSIECACKFIDEIKSLSNTQPHAIVFISNYESQFKSKRLLISELLSKNIRENNVTIIFHTENIELYNSSNFDFVIVSKEIASNNNLIEKIDKDNFCIFFDNFHSILTHGNTLLYVFDFTRRAIPIPKQHVDNSPDKLEEKISKNDTITNSIETQEKKITIDVFPYSNGYCEVRVKNAPDGYCCNVHPISLYK